MRRILENSFLARLPALMAGVRDVPCIREVLFAVALTLLAIALLFLAGFEPSQHASTVAPPAIRAGALN